MHERRAGRTCVGSYRKVTAVVSCRDLKEGNDRVMIEVWKFGSRIWSIYTFVGRFNAFVRDMWDIWDDGGILRGTVLESSDFYEGSVGKDMGRVEELDGLVGDYA